MPADPKHLEESFHLWLVQPGATYLFTKGERVNISFTATPSGDSTSHGQIWKVAVEIDGLMYDGKGGHQTVKGVLQDAEKYEAALLAGWRVYRVPGPWIAEGDRAIWRPQVMDTLKALLEA